MIPCAQVKLLLRRVESELDRLSNSPADGAVTDWSAGSLLDVSAQHTSRPRLNLLQSDHGSVMGSAPSGPSSQGSWRLPMSGDIGDSIPCERSPTGPVAPLARARSRLLSIQGASPKHSHIWASKGEVVGKAEDGMSDFQTVVPGPAGYNADEVEAMRYAYARGSSMDGSQISDFGVTQSNRGGEDLRLADGEFLLQRCWIQAQNSLGGALRASMQRHPRGEHPLDADGVTVDSVERLSSGLQRWIASPTSNKRLAWDFAGAILIFFDLIIIPLRLLEIPETPFTTALNWIALLYWTVNMVATPFVGYVKNGKTIMDPMAIFLNYMRLWFWLDCVVVIPDWVFAVASLSSDDSSGSSVRLVRILRLTRMVRLIRVGKLKAIIRSIVDLIDSEYMSIVWNIVMMIWALLFLNHFVACSFCAVGKLDPSNPRTWVIHLGFDQEPIYTQYLTAFHWSMTQFTPSTMDIAPQNTTERLFAICVVIMALVIFAYMVGSITSSLTQLRMMQEDANKAFWTLRRYMRQHGVKKKLSLKIERYCEHAWIKRSEKVSEGNVAALDLLTEQMHRELRCAMNGPHVKCHVLFHYLYAELPIVVQRLASHCLVRSSLARGDVAFVAGEKATRMLFLLSGSLRYQKTRMYDSSTGRSRHIDIAGKPETLKAALDIKSNKRASNHWWLSELALWVEKFDHYGDLSAIQEAELLHVDAVEFAKVLGTNPDAHRVACTYGQEFATVMLSGNIFSDIEIIRVEEVTVFMDCCHAMQLLLMPDIQEELSETGSQPGLVQWSSKEDLTPKRWYHLAYWLSLRRKLIRKLFGGGLGRTPSSSKSSSK